MTDDERPIVPVIPQQLIYLHYDIMHKTNDLGRAGVRSRSVLANCTDYPFTKVYDKHPFPTIFDKAAALLHSIITWQPFLKGNKRTALVAMMYFLELNGYRFCIPLDVISVIRKVGSKDMEFEISMLAKWIRQHSSKNTSHFGSLRRKLS